MRNLAEKKLETLGSLARDSAGLSQPETEPQLETSLVSAFVEHLADLGIEQAFGVSGGAIALLFGSSARAARAACEDIVRAA